MKIFDKYIDMDDILRLIILIGILVLMYHGRDGWGWLMFLFLMIS